MTALQPGPALTLRPAAETLRRTIAAAESFATLQEIEDVVRQGPQGALEVDGDVEDAHRIAAFQHYVLTLGGAIGKAMPLVEASGGASSHLLEALVADLEQALEVGQTLRDTVSKR